MYNNKRSILQSKKKIGTRDDNLKISVMSTKIKIVPTIENRF